MSGRVPVRITDPSCQASMTSSLKVTTRRRRREREADLACPRGAESALTKAVRVRVSIPFHLGAYTLSSQVESKAIRTNGLFLGHDIGLAAGRRSIQSRVSLFCSVVSKMETSISAYCSFGTSARLT